MKRASVVVVVAQAVVAPAVVAQAIVALAAVGVVGAGCTSFAFKNSGKGTAPSELMDRAAMVKIPGGAFDSGAQEAEPDEYPPHKVTVHDFYIDKTEIAAGDYARCVQARVCRAPAPDDDDDGDKDKSDRVPVVGVSWFDAVKYCEWVDKRLPTEAEWEFAARAPKLGKFPWEGRFDPNRANTAGASDGYERLAPVGSFPTGASGYGLLDMSGNAAEWVNDWYLAVEYNELCGLGQAKIGPDGKALPQGDCKTTKDPTGPQTPTGTKVVRGGSWTSNGDYLVRATSRTSLDPNISNDSVGFRCAADK